MTSIGTRSSQPIFRSVSRSITSLKVMSKAVVRPCACADRSDVAVRRPDFGQQVVVLGDERTIGPAARRQA
jgi:hypothetical protein